MCNFVPGQVFAIGPTSALSELGEGLPGTITVRPLASESVGPLGESAFSGISAAVLQTEPGLELYALSQLSARLSEYVVKGSAIVDLNHILPFGADVASPESLRLSAPALRLASGLRVLLRGVLGSGRSNDPSQRPLRVCVLDSGLDPRYVPHRKVTFYDYSSEGQLRLDVPQADPIGHGTRVVKILDEILPVDVELIAGRLPADPSQLTCLAVAHAVGDLVARTSPDVLNLSVAPRDNVFLCPECGRRVPMPSFLPSFFSLVLRLAGKSAASTVTVMAAGNTGQVPNSRWLNTDLTTLLIAVAENRSGEQTRYSGAPSGPLADLYSASAFGGDDPDDVGAVGVFADGAHGTSFAAPFLTATTLLAKRLRGPFLDGVPSDLGPTVRRLMKGAAEGKTLLIQSGKDFEDQI